MRILNVIPSLSLSTGGPAVNTVSLANVLQNSGIKIALVTTDAKMAAQGGDPRASVSPSDFPEKTEDLDVSIFPRRQPFRLAYSPALAEALNSSVRNYDLVHIHGLYLHPTYAAWRSAVRHDVPFVISPHGALSPWIRHNGRLHKGIMDILWQRSMLNAAGAVQVTTEVERQQIDLLTVKAPLVVASNGLSVGQFSNWTGGIDFRRKHLRGFDGLIIMNHGRLSPVKGLDILLCAFARIAKDPSLQLVLIGGDDEGYGAKLRGLADEMRISDSLTIVDKLSGAELIEAIQAADIWVLPSHSENFGLAVVEAMASGKPVITSPHVNMAPEAAAADALVMVPNTPEDMAQSIQSLIDDTIRRSQLSRHASEYAWRYDWSNVAQEYLQLYAGVIESHQI